MKQFVLAVMVGLGTLALAHQSHAACANGVYRAGCAGPNGAAVVHKSTPAKPAVSCAKGATERDASDRMGPRSSASHSSAVGSAGTDEGARRPHALMIGAFGLVGIFL